MTIVRYRACYYRHHSLTSIWFGRVEAGNLQGPTNENPFSQRRTMEESTGAMGTEGPGLLAGFVSAQQSSRALVWDRHAHHSPRAH